MAAADLPGSDEERAEAALIAAAGKILRSDNREVPEDFVAALFAHAVPEDLLRYDPRQLAELAADAWSLLAVRKPGVPKIRLNAPDSAGHERLRADSVLEVVNDDMPFLVDSVLAELAERGLDVRFVVHPVLSVLRDDAGRLTAFKGTKPAAGALRESVIYVHIERIEEEARRAEIVEAIE
ncbi:MAG TPA: NAD-glutamate dehydrogenase, partial [Xanthobacteraceae bacterium]|nr:NAD-glutamate dehydrogenase [Xanthobacteraceae bacterium]